MYGFSKGQLANIDVDEERQFKEVAKCAIALTEQGLGLLVRNVDFVEEKANEQEVQEWCDGCHP